MSTTIALAPAALDTISRPETPHPHRLSSPTSAAPALVDPPTIVRRTSFWATVRRACRRVGRWLVKTAGWLGSAKGKTTLAIAGEALTLAGMVSRATMSDTLDAIALAAAPFAPSRREGPRVVWG